MGVEGGDVMTNKEKDLVNKAIDLLMEDDCQFHKALAILCDLIGRKHNYDETENIKSVDACQFAALLNRGGGTL